MFINYLAIHFGYLFLAETRFIIVCPKNKVRKTDKLSLQRNQVKNRYRIVWPMKKIISIHSFET